jgi:hypothetical protein
MAASSSRFAKASDASAASESGSCARRFLIPTPLRPARLECRQFSAFHCVRDDNPPSIVQLPCLDALGDDPLVNGAVADLELLGQFPDEPFVLAKLDGGAARPSPGGVEFLTQHDHADALLGERLAIDRSQPFRVQLRCDLRNGGAGLQQVFDALS